MLQPTAPAAPVQNASLPTFGNGSPSAPPSVRPIPAANVTNTSLQNTTKSKQSITITLIHAPDCPQCLAGDNLVNESTSVFNQSSTLAVGSEDTIESSSQEAQGLISKYNITLLPALIISGNVSADPQLVEAWNSTVGTVESDGSLVSRQMPPPYYDIASGKISGLVTGIAIAPGNCTMCANSSMYFNSLSDPYYGVVFKNETIYAENSSEGQALIAKYNLTRLPALMLDPEIPGVLVLRRGDKARRFGGAGRMVRPEGCLSALCRPRQQQQYQRLRGLDPDREQQLHELHGH